MTIAHTATIAKTGGEPVSEFLLIPFGQVTVERALAGGSFTFTREQAAQAVAWFTASGRKLVIDYEHQSIDDLNTRADGLRPAARVARLFRGGTEPRRPLMEASARWASRLKLAPRIGTHSFNTDGAPAGTRGRKTPVY